MPERKFDHAVLDENAKRAAAFLKSLANRNRLLILCHLVEGERTVGELQEALALRQPTLSQQLARLREDGIVATRRQSKNIYYSLASPEAEDIVGRLYDLFCARDVAGRTGARS